MYFNNKAKLGRQLTLHAILRVVVVVDAAAMVVSLDQEEAPSSHARLWGVCRLRVVDTSGQTAGCRLPEFALLDEVLSRRGAVQIWDLSTASRAYIAYN